MTNGALGVIVLGSWLVGAMSLILAVAFMDGYAPKTKWFTDLVGKSGGHQREMAVFVSIIWPVALVVALAAVSVVSPFVLGAKGFKHLGRRLADRRRLPQAKIDRESP